jgi:hypothetical protein
MDHISARFRCLKNRFPRTSEANIKEGVFVWSQMMLMQDVKFDDQLSDVENQHGNH